jgi:eukaryotic-like serine/threonine-protein kinase
MTPGTRIGTYEVIERIGFGGMGEVYRARDTKLNRDVALKVVLAAVAKDPDRLARFKREAHVLASLNHPNIAQIHGFEDSGDTHALVMELVEGPTLADRLAAGAIPVDEAMPLAKQIAEAVEAAHERGVIHRDLKPANIKVRADGTVKVLDFGLAKALEPGSGIADQAPVTGASPPLPPTITSPLTLQGVILGTAAYMSPEQARGRVVDRRADIWAFGCVLFEMLTGARAFDADDVTDTMVAVLSKEPDWPRLPASAVAVRPLLVRCLKKDPRQRLQAIGDARLQIEELISGTSESLTSPAGTKRSSRGVASRTIAALVGGAVATLVTWAVMRPAPQDRRPAARFELNPSTAHALSMNIADRNLAISPDGLHIVYRAGPSAELVVRAVDRLETRVLDATAGARYPFFSPDGRWVGFFDGVALKKVSIAGGPVTTICPSQIPRGASWGENGTIVFATQDKTTGLLRVPAAGGEPTVLTTPDAARGERDHHHVSWLPQERAVLFTIVPTNPADPPHVALLDVQTGQRKTLIRGGSQPAYVETGHLVYAAANTLNAVRFDLDRLAVVGDPAHVTDPVLMSPELGGAFAANYAVSWHGTLVYVPTAVGAAARSLVWVDRTGRETPTGAPPNMYAAPRLSPDGRRIALEIRDRQNDIHVLDLARRAFVRLSPGASVETSPIWTPDGQRIVFSSRRDGSSSSLYAQAADGAGTVERLTTGADFQEPAWVAPDGTGILGEDISPKTAGDIVWFPLTTPSRLPNQQQTDSPGVATRVLNSPFIEYRPEVSPNGRYVAYLSNESGRDEIYVRPFPRVQDGIWRVSTDGGVKSAWARNGRELYYLDPSSVLNAVPVDTAGPRFSFGTPVKLFQMASDAQAYAPRDYDVAQDGRFLVVKPDAPASRRPADMVVIMNWFEELMAKLPRAR